MKSKNALRTFESALNILTSAARTEARADLITRKNTAFKSFADLINAEGGYRPSLSRAEPVLRELGALYDAAQTARGDDRRAYMYGNPVRKGSIIDRRNWVASDSWYRVGRRIAWWDRYTRQWIAYTLDTRGNQDGPADLYPNAGALLRAEECHD
jgi:hypothetical protein